MEHFYENIEGWGQMGDVGKLFEQLTENINNKIKIAEIGVYQGKSTAMICVILINKGIDFEYHAIDHFKGSLEHVKGLDYESIARRNLEPLMDRITIHVNDSVPQSKLFPDGYFDIVYIDASHDYESVKLDILSWLPKVKKGGYICGDDYSTSWIGVFDSVNEIFGEENVNTLGVQKQWYVKVSE
jgi:predicted O-methyltransferase YrrM